MNTTDRFLIIHKKKGPVYTSDRIDGVIAYLWGRFYKDYRVFAYETPVPLAGPNLDDLRSALYKTVLILTHGRGVETPL